MIYDDLMDLCENNEAFFFKDHKYEDGGIYRIFNYRLASYTDFLEAGALECRGIMFDVTEDVPVLVSLPMSKFFNYQENPFTENLDLSQIDYVMEKRDGSLISTFFNRKGTISLKTKGSLYSEQAINATEYLENNEELRRYVINILHSFPHGATINFEWTAPHNRVVVPYQEEELTILNVRLHTGEYLNVEELANEAAKKYWVGGFTVDSGEEFVHSIPKMNSSEDSEVFEGYVVKMNDGMMFKCKTERYLRLHRTKDDITNPKRLFALIVHEEVDDVRSLFHYDQYLLNIIDEMEKQVEPKFNHMITQVENFYSNNKELDRKSYAIKGQKEMHFLFPLVMQLYLGKDVDYKAFAIKNMEKFL